jgi:Tol biopolymer transport system component
VPGKNGRIAFVRSAGAGPLEEVLMANPSAAPGPVVNLTNDPLTSDTAPSWSPDGTRVAFTREGPGGTTSIRTVSAADGSNDNPVTPAGGDQDDGLPLHVHTVTLATGATTQVTAGPVQDLMPSWQPL